MNKIEQTELSAVNILLVAIGDPKVNDLEIPNADVAAARVVLNDIRQEVLSVGWWFNQVEGVTLTPDQGGEIPVPANTLELDCTDSAKHYVQRGTKLFDMDNQTFKFTAPVKVDIILDLPFEELPRTAYQCVTAQAALEFAGSYELDEIQLKRLTAKATKMGQMLKKSNLRSKDVNVFNSQRAQAFLGGMPTR